MAYKEVGCARLPSYETNKRFLFHVLFYDSEVLPADILQAKSVADDDKDVVRPLILALREEVVVFNHSFLSVAVLSRLSEVKAHQTVAHLLTVFLSFHSFVCLPAKLCVVGAEFRLARAATSLKNLR